MAKQQIIAQNIIGTAEQRLKEQTAPGAAPSGSVYLYAKADGLLYSKDDAGAETQLGGGSGAATDLSNLTATQINQDLVFDKAAPVVQSENEVGSTNSENMYLKSGDVVDGISGSVEVDTGAASGTGSSGNVVLGGIAPQVTLSSPLKPTAPNTQSIGDSTDYFAGVSANAFEITDGTNSLTLGAGASGGALIYTAPVSQTASGAWINVAGDGVLQERPVSYWFKVTKSYTDFSTAGLTNTINLYQLSAREMIEDIVVKTTTAFSGGSISAYSFSAGDTTNGASQFVVGYDGFAAVSGTNFSRTSVSNGLYSFTATEQLTITATSVGANLNAATAGSVDIYIKISELMA